MNEKDNIVIVYLKKDLEFNDIIPKIKKYALKEYIEFSKELTDKVNDAAGNLKKIFDNYYKKGRNIYSRFHGKVEVDLLSKGLEKYKIKSCLLRETTELVIIIMGEFSTKKIENIRKQNLRFENIFEEIEQYLKEYKLNKEGEIVKR